MRAWAAAILLASAAASASPSGATGTPLRMRRWGPSAAGTGIVVFTFDDGPSFETTPALLDSLDRWRVRALFFVNGRRFACDTDVCRRNRETLLDVRRHGHAIGNHTFGHRRLGDLPPPRQRWELLRNEEAILRVAGVRPSYYRPPYGPTGSAGARFAAERGCLKVLWDVEPRDHAVRSAKKVAGRVMESLRRGNGGIVLLHDIHTWSIGAFGLTMQAIERENLARARVGQPPLRVADPEEALGPMREKLPGARASADARAP